MVCEISQEGPSYSFGGGGAGGAYLEWNELRLLSENVY